MLTAFFRWALFICFAALGLVMLFIAWWLLVILALALALTLWIRKLLGKPPMFQAVFHRGVNFGSPPGDVGSGGVEPPAQGAVVIEGEYMVEGEAGQKERPRLDGGNSTLPPLDKT